MMYWDSFVGKYLIQGVFHALIVAVVVEALLKIWHIHKPHYRLRFRLLIIIFPALAMPLYQVVYPQRQGDQFRFELAIFDSARWLSLPLFDNLVVGHILIILTCLVSIIFLGQEVIPFIRQVMRIRRHSKTGKVNSPKLKKALMDINDSLGGGIPPVVLTNSTKPIIHTSGFIRSDILISKSIIDSLDPDELKGALAHEIIHIVRRDHLKLGVLFFFRILMFFNPIVLIAFRRIIQDTEKVCDDLAVAISQKPLALASGLIKVYRIIEGDPLLRQKGRRLRLSLGLQAKKACLTERVERLVRPRPNPDLNYPNTRLVMTAMALALLLFFVV